MASNGQLRRAVKYARRNGWRIDHTADTVFRTWPVGGWVRAIQVEWDGRRRHVLRVRELNMMDGRRVSIGRAIRVLTAEYDDHGNMIA